MTGNLRKRCFRGRRDHKRPLWESDILQGVRPAHSQTPQYSHLERNYTNTRNPTGCFSGRKEEADPMRPN